MQYNQALDYLNSLQMHTIKLGLTAMRSLLAKLGNPDRKLKIIHVAGTNGKGSVCAMLSAILAEAGYRVGVYTSPHLFSVRERFRIDNHYISEAEFAQQINTIVQALGNDAITYFECTTALALLWFAGEQPDCVILETGLGGRLDATNVVQPLLSIITSLSLDHQAYLGTQLPDIAREKAGIIKHLTPVVAAGSDPAVEMVLGEKALAEHAPLYVSGRDFICAQDDTGVWQWRGYAVPLAGQIADLRCALAGDHQGENAALALAACRLLRKQDFAVSDENCRSGLHKVFWPGRMEKIVISADRKKCLVPDSTTPDAVHFLCDGAHNPDGVRALAEYLKQQRPQRCVLIWGAMKDKDIRAGLCLLAPLAEVIFLTMAESERSAAPPQLYECLDVAERGKAILEADAVVACQVAMRMAKPHDLIVVAGSLYLVGKIRTFLCGELAGNG